ncbi:hypothetical protein PsorP6_009736 [Peronosclerospora sorghi]|uniref:Uncharacterized protein n=1 Tax=Peronosclerospora sorghi TaxID=230839 RepID=A0ACC0W169_9STRA|nr:hypothetical protein PsorP6_009736 [Peronosclerospora sorghi]
MSTAAGSGSLPTRVHKLLTSRTELEATKDLVRTLLTDELTSCVPSDACPGSKRTSVTQFRDTFRSKLATHQLALAQRALAGLECTLDHVSDLATRVDALDTKCDHVLAFLDTTKTATQQVQTDAVILATKRNHVLEEWKETTAFLERYQLQEDDVRLVSADHVEDQMDAFLGTLERVQQVKGECKKLVATGDVHCGLELLEAISHYEEIGFNKLYEWTATTCAAVDGEPSPWLHRAIHLLRDRTDFYNYCKEKVTASRRALLVRRFMMALTVGGPNGIPRPIDMSAQDPVKYCSEMLAWVHEAIATESDFFRVLFDGDVECSPSPFPEASQGSRSSVSTDHSPTNEETTGDEGCISMVGRAFDSVARPLQVRIEQTLCASHGLVIAYQLVHVLAFYHDKVDQLVAPAQVARTLGHCREVANDTFRRDFELLVDTVAASAPDYGANLGVTHPVLDLSHRVVALLEIRQTSLVPEQEKEADVAPLLDAIVPAIERMCQRHLTLVEPAEALVFRINNFSCLHARLRPFPHAIKWYRKLDEDLNRWLHRLSDVEAARVLDRAQVSTLVQLMRDFEQNRSSEQGTLAAETRGLDGETITQVMTNFSATLRTLTLPALEYLVQPAMVDQARTRTCTTLASTYAFVYDFVSDARNGYILPSTEPSSLLSSIERGRRVVLPPPPAEMRTLLDVREENT